MGGGGQTCDSTTIGMKTRVSGWGAQGAWSRGGDAPPAAATTPPAHEARNPVGGGRGRGGRPCTATTTTTSDGFTPLADGTRSAPGPPSAEPNPGVNRGQGQRGRHRSIGPGNCAPPSRWRCTLRVVVVDLTSRSVTRHLLRLGTRPVQVARHGGGDRITRHTELLWRTPRGTRAITPRTPSRPRPSPRHASRALAPALHPTQPEHPPLPPPYTDSRAVLYRRLLSCHDEVFLLCPLRTCPRRGMRRPP